MLSTLKFLIVFAIAFPAVMTASLYLLQDWLIFPAPDLEVDAVWDEHFETVSIPTADGERLFALQHRAEGDEATIMVFHGNGDAAVYQLDKGKKLAASGFGVLLVEYRGYPGSTGRPSAAGLFEDGRAAFDFVRAQTSGPIGLYAHSLGTGVAVRLASEREAFAVVLESSYDSITAIAQQRFPWLPVRWLLKHRFESDRVVHTIKAPILMIHGDRDQVVPIEHGKRLHRAAPAGTEFREIKGAGHNDLSRHGTIEAAVGFFRQVLERPI